MSNTDIQRLACEPSDVLLATQAELISVMQLNTNLVTLTLEPDLNFLIPSNPYYLSIYENGIKMINSETINPFNISTTTSEVTCEMDIMVTYWLNHCSDQAERLNNQLINSTEMNNGLVPQWTAIVAALNQFDAFDPTDTYFIFSEPMRFIRKDKTTRYQGLTTNLKGSITNPYWSNTKMYFTVKFLWDITSVVNLGAYSIAYSDAYDITQE